jgi:hypothetical protein
MKESYRDKVEKLIDEILDTTPMISEVHNIGYEYSCPFCYAWKHVDWSCMNDLKHEDTCAWLMAKKLREEHGK